MIKTLIVWIIAACSLIVSLPSNAEKTKPIDFSEYDFYPLPAGFQEELPSESEAIINNFDGKFYLLSLEDHFDGQTAYLQTKYTAMGIYYPIVILLDENYQYLEVITPKKDELDNVAMNGIDVIIPLLEQARYMVISTFGDLKNQSFTDVYSGSSTFSTYAGNGGVPFYYTVSTGLKKRELELASEAPIKLMLPQPWENKPTIRYPAWSIYLGVRTGTKKVTQNPDGGYYKAGGGMFFEVGHSFRIPKTSALMARAMIGFRSEGGESENSGYSLKLESYWLKGSWGMGLGAYSDFTNKIKDKNGNTIRFEDSIYPELFVEFRYRPMAKGSLRVSYAPAKYRTEDGENFNAGLFGIGFSIEN